VCPASNTPDGRHLTLSTRRPTSGLPFPATSGRDYGQLIPHGPHCIEEIQAFTAHAPNNDMDRMHNDHCLCLAHRAIDWVTSLSHYHIPEVLCEDVRSLYVSPLGEVYAYFTYPISWTNFGQSAPTNESMGIASAHATYTELAKLARAGDEHEQDVFGLASGQNLGELLLRDWRDGRETLSAAEKAFVLEWEAPAVVRLAVYGMTCIGIREGGGGHHHEAGAAPVAAHAGVPIIAHGMYHPPIDKLKEIVARASFFNHDTCADYGH